MTTPTEQSATTESETSDLTPDQQIAELLMDEETPSEEEAEPTNPEQTEDEDSLPQEEETEAEEEAAEESENQEEAEDKEPETWATALGLDESQVVLDDNDNFVGVMTKVEGKTKQVDLKELVKGYQIDTYNTKKSEALTADRQRFEQMAQQQAEEMGNRMQHASGLVTTLEEQLVGEFQGVNWEQLRASDPAEYSALRQDYAVRYNQVKQMAVGIQQQQSQLQQQKQQEFREANNKRLQQEVDLVLQAKPAWNDPDVRVKAMTEMGGFITKYGYSDQEIAAISDHRVIRMIDDLMAYNSIKKEGMPKLNKKVPKYVKPLANRKTGGNTKAKKLDKLYQKASASKDRKLKDNAIEQLLLNS